MSINKRIFGTPLKGIVKKKLEARQGVTDNLEPGESLERIAVSNYDYANKLLLTTFPLILLKCQKHPSLNSVEKNISDKFVHC